MRGSQGHQEHFALRRDSTEEIWLAQSILKHHTARLAELQLTDSTDRGLSTPVAPCASCIGHANVIGVHSKYGVGGNKRPARVPEMLGSPRKRWLRLPRCHTNAGGLARLNTDSIHA